MFKIEVVRNGISAIMRPFNQPLPCQEPPQSSKFVTAFWLQKLWTSHCMKCYMKKLACTCFFPGGGCTWRMLCKEEQPRVQNPDANILAQRNPYPPKVGQHHTLFCDLL